MAIKVVSLENLSYFKTKQDGGNNTKFLQKSQLGVDVASLVGGKIPLSQIPATAITDTFVVVSQTEMLALQAQIGDVAIRTDLKKSFILRIDNPASLSSWQELLTPDDQVQSVNGQTGVVIILDATTSLSGLMSAGDKIKLNGLNNYSLPTATASVLGGVKIGSNLTISNGVVSAPNPYTHPTNHPASVITQDANNRFVSDAEKSAWNGKASTALATTTTDGLMSKEDKTKLNGLENIEYATNEELDLLFQ